MKSLQICFSTVPGERLAVRLLAGVDHEGDVDVVHGGEAPELVERRLLRVELLLRSRRRASSRNRSRRAVGSC